MFQKHIGVFIRVKQTCLQLQLLCPLTSRGGGGKALASVKKAGFFSAPLFSVDAIDALEKMSELLPSEHKKLGNHINVYIFKPSRQWSGSVLNLTLKWSGVSTRAIRVGLPNH